MKVYKFDYLECRAYGHHWKPVDVTGDRHYLYQRLDCQHCGARRTDTIKRSTCETTSRSYAYPDGFVTKKGEMKLSRRDVKRGLLAVDLAGQEGPHLRMVQ